MATKIPRVEFAFVNGTGTLSCDFPAKCLDDSIIILQDQMVFETPYGKTVPLKLIRLEPRVEGELARDVLVVPMHGWHFNKNFSRIQSSDQIYWLLKQAGVKKIIGEASAGGLNLLLEPGDIVVPDDFIETRVNRGETFPGVDVRMNEPFCNDLRSLLIDEAHKHFPRVFRKGVTVSYEGPRYATAAEVRMIRQWGGDILGQSVTPDVYYARTIGACFAVVNLVSHVAEGSDEDWGPTQMRELYQASAPKIAAVITGAMRRIRSDVECGCSRYFNTGN
jgi:5'-methylthioadenosine phosphorylase